MLSLKDMNGVVVQAPDEMYTAYSSKFKTLTLVVTRPMDDSLEASDVVAEARRIGAVTEQDGQERLVVLFLKIPTPTGQTPVEASSYTEQEIYDLIGKTIARA